MTAMLSASSFQLPAACYQLPAISFQLSAIRSGRAKKFFSVTPSGLRATRRTRRAFMTLWKGIPELKGTPV
jgi:hypothetical protein